MNVDNISDAVPEPGHMHIPAGKLEQLKLLFSTYQTETERRTNREVDHLKDLADSFATRAGIFEKILLLAGGTLALSINFISTLSAQLHTKGLIEQLKLYDRCTLYAAWVCLMLAVFACSCGWFLQQYSFQRTNLRRLLRLSRADRERAATFLKSVETSIKGTKINLGPQKDSNEDTIIDMAEVFSLGANVSSKAAVETIAAEVKFGHSAELFRLNLCLIICALTALPVGFLMLLVFAIRSANIILRS